MIQQIQIIATPSELQAIVDNSIKHAFEKLSLPTASETGINEAPVSTREIRLFLGITEPTLIRWREKGKIPYLRIGSRVVYQKTAVVNALSKFQKKSQR